MNPAWLVYRPKQSLGGLGGVNGESDEDFFEPDNEYELIIGARPDSRFILGCPAKFGKGGLWRIGRGSRLSTGRRLSETLRAAKVQDRRDPGTAEDAQREKVGYKKISVNR